MTQIEAQLQSALNNLLIASQAEIEGQSTDDGAAYRFAIQNAEKVINEITSPNSPSLLLDEHNMLYALKELMVKSRDRILFGELPDVVCNYQFAVQKAIIFGEMVQS